MLTRIITHASLTLAVLALAAIPAAAQVRGPGDVTVQTGRLASVPLVIDGDESDYVVLGPDVDAFREYTTDPKQIRLRVIGYVPGVAYVTVASQKAGKLQPLFTVKVTITGAGPSPGPLPPPPVPDPTPDDPLAVSFRKAAADDKLTAAQLGKLASAFRVASTLKRETAADFQGGVNALLKIALPARPEALWPLVQAELRPLDAILPADQPDKVITDADRVKIQAVFTRLATAMEKAVTK